MLSKRVKAGMDGARRQGNHVGLPPVTARPGFAEQWAAVRADLEAKRIRRSEAARRQDCGYATLLRMSEVAGRVGATGSPRWRRGTDHLHP